MRRRDHDRIVHEKDKTIARLEQQNRELLDRLMFVADKTWMPPPAVDSEPTPEPHDFMWAPEQHIDEDLEPLEVE